MISTVTSLDHWHIVPRHCIINGNMIALKYNVSRCNFRRHARKLQRWSESAEFEAMIHTRFSIIPQILCLSPPMAFKGDGLLLAEHLRVLHRNSLLFSLTQPMPGSESVSTIVQRMSLQDMKTNLSGERRFCGGS